MPIRKAQAKAIIIKPKRFLSGLCLINEYPQDWLKCSPETLFRVSVKILILLSGIVLHSH